MWRRGKGFTLIELLAVLLLMALLGTAVSLSLKGVVRETALRSAVSQLVRFDRLAREQTRRFDQPLKLRFQSNERRVLQVDPRTDRRRGSALELPAGVSIEQVLTAEDNAPGTEVDVAYFSSGQTASYAVLLVGPGQQRQWLVVTGLSGQTETLKDDQDVRQIFTLLAGGYDAR